MATEILIKNATSVVWANAGDYNPAAGVVYTRTAAMDLTSLASGAARQIAKVDLGAARAEAYDVILCPELNVAPGAGETIEVYFSKSNSATTGLDNPGFCTGADAAYTGSTGGTIAQTVKLMGNPFVYVATPDVAPISLPMHIGILYPTTRWLCGAVVNNTAQAFEGDAIEMFLALLPIITESQ